MTDGAMMSCDVAQYSTVAGVSTIPSGMMENPEVKIENVNDK